MPKFARAFGQSRKHGVSMGNGFIPRQIQSPGQVTRRLNGLFFHDKILARALSSFRPRLINTRIAAFSFTSFTSLTSCTSGQFFAEHVLSHTLKSGGFAMRIMD